MLGKDGNSQTTTATRMRKYLYTLKKQKNARVVSEKCQRKIKNYERYIEKPKMPPKFYIIMKPTRPITPATRPPATWTLLAAPVNGVTPEPVGLTPEPVPLAAAVPEPTALVKVAVPLPQPM